MIRSFFKKHPDLAITCLAVLFVLVMIGSVIFAIETIITRAGQAIGASPSGSKIATGFDLDGAKALDLKGLVPK